jgi:hypothetical protein
VLFNADCAEEFEFASAEPAEAGNVMIVDGENRVRIADRAYDKRVVGVVSGAGGLSPALVLDGRLDKRGRVPLALVGKVFCKVDATVSAIEVGDLLTTAQTPGHAMKASDAQKAFGAVLGKALRALESGRDLIPVLVALQ